ncbi:tautomerase family protein [Candidatus Pantoea deserta]|uniref:Tautomerase family protein n=1 Tax=Candidatus Pantoea deserta TaxID=1869313 RepID=A0A3N4P7Z2_9GAMM|nr:tautomerase family protein [Pantoea deserta]RPD99839.1 tautomerase family protein [Pantoea deserta]
MPLTRITLHQDLSAAHIATLSEILHSTLVETFDVPVQDKFQIIERLPAAQRIYDRHYLSGTRSDNFILFTLLAGKPRSAAQKSALYQRLTQRLEQQLNIHPDDVMVVIQFNTTADWSFSNGKMHVEETP